ncbi:unnamed protein product [Tilletia controversa]|nr:unnamed protein product [Tilletia controversa]
MAESSERALLIDPRALARAAQTVQTALGHSSAPNSYSNPAFRESDHHIYDPGPDLFEDELDSDYGSDEEHAPYEHPQSSIVAIPLLPYIGRSRTVNPSRSRFHSWHIKVAAIFDIAYGLEPAPIALPGTISLDCSCPPSANSRRPRTIKVYDVGSPFVTPVKPSGRFHHDLVALVSNTGGPSWDGRAQHGDDYRVFPPPWNDIQAISNPV